MILKANKYNERIGVKKLNNTGELMKVIEYKNANDITVEFQDEHKLTVCCTWQRFQKGNIINPLTYKERLGQEKYNHQNCLMKIVEYNNATDIVVEFQDKHKAKVHTQYSNFLLGNVKNPYYPSLFNVGIIGNKYPISTNSKHIKEYNAWKGVLERSYDKKLKEKYSTYKNVVCCKDWLNYENFYEWLHSQPNFDKWYNGKRWAIDKDILNKGNKIYSPENCCLVPHIINGLFVKGDARRGKYPIGVHKHINKFQALCNNPFVNKTISLGLYKTPHEAFQAYKKAKESYIKQVAQVEYDKGNITEQCYEVMMGYKVEITD